MFYFLINVHMYILLSKAIVIEASGGGGVLARICFSDIQAKWCHFRQYLFMHPRQDRIAYYESNGYLNRDVAEASENFLKENIALVSPTIAKYLEDRLFSVSFLGLAFLFSNSASPPPPPIRIIRPSPKIQIDEYSNFKRVLL